MVKHTDPQYFIFRTLLDFRFFSDLDIHYKIFLWNKNIFKVRKKIHKKA